MAREYDKGPVYFTGGKKEGVIRWDRFAVEVFDKASIHCFVLSIKSSVYVY